MNHRIGILLLVLVQLGHSSPIIVKRSDESQAVQQINALRVQFAEAKQVANMHELSWDSDLASKAAKASCEDLEKPASNYMMAFYPDMNTMNKIQSDQDKKDFVKNNGLLAFLIPVQTRMGCASLKQTCGDKQAVCFIGPKSVASYNPEVDAKRGLPGSQCPNGKASSGLCKFSKSTLSFASIIVMIIFTGFF
ncbi:hypothetical protein GCK72_012161 [Caenorhabditis remanei]|uniref:SCP domain-containing protein n=1 Tax=Caenorhabditis remanei TaxID=31234 RepID=A0A6A5GM42_CAERE|nr:hypothetical protein GCK72_012161 [Caenorhabditis remanei]KAF1755711.1 hypothetical protein GCK72_012161 [Caenorhabditis remanei]